MAEAEGHYDSLDLQQRDDATYEDLNTRPRPRVIPPSDTRRNKRVGVGVGLLVAVLVLLNVAVPLYLHQSYTVERGQLMNSYNQVLAKTNNLTDQLAKTNNLTKERDQLLDRITNLTVERDDMKRTLCDQSYKVEKEQLVISYNNLIKERDQLLYRNNHLAVERDGMKSMLCESPGWQKFDGGLYYISTERKTWEDSRQWCIDRQSDLIVIRSQRKQDFVASFNKRVWLGLTDTEREGSFQWVDGTPLTTPTYWMPGTPNNKHPNTNEEEDCAEYYDGSYPGVLSRGWNDAPCSTSKNWICERVLC